MQAQELTEHHKKLLALVGEWEGEEKIHPMPWDARGGTATSRGTTRADLGGFFVISDYAQERDGKVCYRGHGVFGWDPRQARYTMHWFDTMGGDPGAPALGTWEGDTLQFLHEHALGHSRVTYRFPADGAYTFRIEYSQDGATWVPFIDGTYRRKS